MVGDQDDKDGLAMFGVSGEFFFILVFVLVDGLDGCRFVADFG